MLRAVNGYGHVARMLWLHQDEHGRLERLHRINEYHFSTGRLETLT